MYASRSPHYILCSFRIIIKKYIYYSIEYMKDIIMILYNRNVLIQFKFEQIKIKFINFIYKC